MGPWGVLWIASMRELSSRTTEPWSWQWTVNIDLSFASWRSGAVAVAAPWSAERPARGSPAGAAHLVGLGPQPAGSLVDQEVQHRFHLSTSHRLRNPIDRPLVGLARGHRRYW
jgi:hypothetical protein